MGPLVKGEKISKKFLIFFKKFAVCVAVYDYKLPIEDIKIICHCGARNCRGYMN
jgi:hypothetical protein